LLQGAAAAAPSLGVEVLPARIKNDPADIERTIVALASAPSSGIFILPDSTTSINRDLIITLAARNRVPAVWTGRLFAAAGGLMSYGVVYADQYRQAASYVDRILRGAKPGDLPVQTPTRYETVLNLKAAKELGLTVSAGLFVAADEVIE
jgi:putative ABC transport system substrate-binding protein